MNDEWMNRLEAIIAQDGRSKREISVAAGRGVNYLQQAMKDGKKMSASNLVGILDVLGGASALYVLTGLDISREDEEIFRLLLGMDPKIRQAARNFLQDLANT